ncbi:MAG: hypothetical protein H7067_17235, partial [Burkholderiales bacterium]|nr:hypothetical protein [Opitutaceae bacterium]
MLASLRSRLAPSLLGLCLLAPLPAAAHDAPGEYFFNDDPGLGAATPLPLAEPPPALAEIDTLALPLPAAPTSGVSILGIRFRTAGGDWGPTRLHRLHLVPGATGPTLSLAWGSSQPVSASPAANGTFTVTRPASAPGDADRLVLRARFGDLPGPASLHRVHPFGRSTPSRLYYALDQGPNHATSTSFVELTEAHRLAPTAISLPVTAAPPGFHALHLQLHDAAGARTTNVRSLHFLPTSTPSLAVAWGSGTPVSLAIAADGTAIITRPASAPGDANRLVIRT